MATIEESLELITGLYHLGYKKLITTPHIFPGVYNNTPEKIFSGLEVMRTAIRNAGIQIKLDAAAEYFFDDKFVTNVRDNNLMTFGDNCVLFELSSMSKPPLLEEIIFELNTGGYTPVLAHPERYTYLHDPKLQQYEDLHNKGVLFQLNVLALEDFYQPPIRKVARRLIKNGLVDLVGSDMHNKNYFNEFKKAINNDYYFELLASGNILNNQFLAD